MASEATGYASIDPAMLCPKCEHGTIRHGMGGRTAVICTAQRQPITVRFIVTACSDFARPEVTKLWPGMSEIPIFRVEDGELRVQVYNRKKGHHEYQLARDVYGEDAAPIARDYDGEMIAVTPPPRWRVRAWWRRLWRR